MKERIYQSFSDLISDLTQREKDIFFKRFGLENKKHSLEDIGKQYNLSRERIRQIQNNIVDKLQSRIINHSFLKKEFYQIVKNSLGELKIKRTFYLKIKFQNNYLFNNEDFSIFNVLLKIHPDIYFVNEDEIYNEFIYLNENDFKVLTEFTDHLLNFFNNNRFVNEDYFLNFLREEIRNHFKIFPAIDEILEFIKLHKIIAKNPFNEFGHINNNRISPTSLVNKIKVILDFEKKPLSYYQIYQKLNELREIEEDLVSTLWSKKYSLNTVLSTLNSNKDFILVGRGTYALRNWGILEGNIVDIMKKIVNENNGLTIDELYEKLSQQRIFNKGTFYVYLYRYFRVIKKRVYCQ